MSDRSGGVDVKRSRQRNLGAFRYGLDAIHHGIGKAAADIDPAGKTRIAELCQRRDG